MLRDESEANVRHRETAVVRKEDSLLARKEGRRQGSGASARTEPLLKTANYFPNLRRRSR